jgi:hypothetical protein
MNINESLKAGDLKYLVKKVFEIDSYKSKIGDDIDVVVVSFTVDHEDPAKDLENFIEMGYDFVLDADVSPGETDDGTYKVYVELERTRHVCKQILEILEGVERLTGTPDMRFRYFKSFKSAEATLQNLEAVIPMDKETYNIATDRSMLENFSNFFANSYADDISVLEESISFKRPYRDTLTFKIVDSGPSYDVHSKIKGPIMLESKDMAEVMFLTKCIGNYNIVKVGSAYIFENSGYAVVLEKQ